MPRARRVRLSALWAPPPCAEPRRCPPRARAGQGALPSGRVSAARCRPASLSCSRLSPTAARPRHGECALRGEALPQLPAAASGASLDRGCSARGARPRAGTTSRPRVSPAPCRRPAGPLPSRAVTSAPHALPAAVRGAGPHPRQGFPTSLCCKHVDSLHGADSAKSLRVAICRSPEGNCAICLPLARGALYNIICGFRQSAKDSVLIFSSNRGLCNKEDELTRM